MTYEAGLAMISTLEALEEFQTTPDSQALFSALQKSDEDSYNRLIAANAKRYQEIEAAERASDQAAAEAEDAEAQEVEGHPNPNEPIYSGQTAGDDIAAENASLFPGDD